MKKNMKREKKRAACFTSIGQLFGSAISLKLLHFLQMYSSLIRCVDEDSDNKDQK